MNDFMSNLKMSIFNYNESILIKILENFRYDLLKILVFILLFAAAILYVNAESEKYYNIKSNNSALFGK